MGNLLLTKLVVNFGNVVFVEIKTNEITCWTDSMVSLAWITRAAKSSIRDQEKCSY